LVRYSHASLCIFSNTGTAEHVTEVLGLVPKESHEKGERRLGREGREYAPHASSMWVYGPDPSRVVDDDSGVAALRALLDDVKGIVGSLATLRPDYRTIIRWSGEVSLQGNFVIDSGMIVALGELGCEFFGTAYPEEGEETPATPLP
jgi:hypothetical protein